YLRPRRASVKPSASNRHLRANFDHSPGRNTEIAGGVIRLACQRNEEPVLPGWHARLWRRPERPARQEERRRHDVEGETPVPRDGERYGHVGGLHETEPQPDAQEGLADGLNPHAFGQIDARP